jgi:hypothetical protein
VLALHQFAGLALQLLMQLCSGVLVALLLPCAVALCCLQALLQELQAGLNLGIVVVLNINSSTCTTARRRAAEARMSVQLECHL